MRRVSSLWFAAAVLVILIAAAASALHQTTPEGVTSAASIAPAAESAPRGEPVAGPVRLQIPSIGVDAPIIKLGLDPTGALEVPTNFGDTGWWSGGARPGEPGPAVIAGHVDSKSGPDVFFRLRELRKGDAIVVTRRDGSRVRFTVEGSERYAKDRFPSKKVYGPTERPALRLITCSGTFDRSTGHYLDNTVVYAA
jgi:sortase (surface protein transpeptidase)